jgi:hypothetical protein
VVLVGGKGVFLVGTAKGKAKVIGQVEEVVPDWGKPAPLGCQGEERKEDGSEEDLH